MLKRIIRRAPGNSPTGWVLRLLDPSSHRVERLAAELAAALPDKARVLDSGAGESPFKRYFDRHSYIAVDGGWGDEAWDYSSLDALCDLTVLPFADNSLDAVLCTQVLEHVNEPALVLAEFQRVLKPGALLYLSAPQGWGVHQAPHDYFRFTRYGLEYLLRKAGFHVNSVKPSCGYFGYLGNRLSVLPKILFWRIRPWPLRLLFAPLEIAFSIVFFILFPLLLNAVDFLDRRRDYTLNYLVKAEKPKGNGA